jgi:protein-disulfide isomerase
MVFVLLTSPCRSYSAAAQQLSNNSQSPLDDDYAVVSVGDEQVSIGDIDSIWRTYDPVGFARLREQEYGARRKALEIAIENSLLKQQARRMGVDVAELRSKIASQASTPSDEQVRAMYFRSTAATQGMSLEQASVSIRNYLTGRMIAEATERYADGLRSAIPVTMRIPLNPMRLPVEIEVSDPVIGSRGSPIEIIEFGDFQCPFCRQLAPILRQLAVKYREEVRIVWKDLPAQSHALAQPAAEAARCAYEQGRFWQYHDALFNNQEKLSSELFRSLATEIGLNLGTFEACVARAKYREQVRRSASEGDRVGVTVTPTVLVNGRPIPGLLGADVYEGVILDELKRADGR